MSTVTPVRNSTARRRNIIWFTDFVISTVKSLGKELRQINVLINENGLLRNC